jgi:hypothetical protein
VIGIQFKKEPQNTWCEHAKHAQLPKHSRPEPIREKKAAADHGGCDAAPKGRQVRELLNESLAAAALRKWHDF